MKRIKFRIYYIAMVYCAGHGPTWIENFTDSAIDKMEDWGWDDGIRAQHSQIIEAFADAMDEDEKRKR